MLHDHHDAAEIRVSRDLVLNPFLEAENDGSGSEPLALVDHLEQRHPRVRTPLHGFPAEQDIGGCTRCHHRLNRDPQQVPGRLGRMRLVAHRDIEVDRDRGLVTPMHDVHRVQHVDGGMQFRCSQQAGKKRQQAEQSYRDETVQTHGPLCPASVAASPCGVTGNRCTTTLRESLPCSTS